MSEIGSLAVTFSLRFIATVIIFGLFLLYPRYVEAKAKGNPWFWAFLLGYLVFFLRILMQPSRIKAEDELLYYTSIGIAFMGTLISMLPDEYLSGLGVEATGLPPVF